MPYYLLSLLVLCILFTCGPALENQSEVDELGYRTEYQTDPETGQRQGLARQYAPDGTLLAEENYLDGQLDGTRTAYYPDGRQEIVETYRAGQFEGEYRTYDSLGNLRLRGQYVDGAMGKDWIRYWPNGEVREVVAFTDNRENGPFREWFENGQPSAAGTYLNGKEEGMLYVYDEADGGLLAVRHCTAGVCTTQWRREDGGTAPGSPPDMQRPAGTQATQ